MVGMLAAVCASATGYASAATTTQASTTVPTAAKPGSQKQHAPPGPAPVRVHKNVVYGQSAAGHPLAADVYAPRAVTSPAPVLIVIHGGGFTHGSKAEVAHYASGLASNGYLAVAINFALIKPGYPEQVREARLAVRWSIEHARQYGGDPQKLGLVGFSAGGYLAAMAGVLDSGLPGRPVKAVASYSAPLDLPALDRLLRARVKACGHRRVCRKMPGTPPVSAFGPLVDFLGCPKGKCSSRVVRNASPSSHVTPKAPAFLMFNSAHEQVPASQPVEMGKVLKAAGVAERVVITPGSQQGGRYVAQESPTLIRFLAQQLRPASIPLVGTGKVASPGTPLWLIIVCAAVAAGGLGAALLATCRRTVASGQRTPAARS